MILTPTDRPWAPQDSPDYLCVLTGSQLPPRNREAFLRRQAELLARLVEEANEGEIENGNRMLEDNLQTEELDYLPSGLLRDPRTCQYLMFNPAVEGAKLHEWKHGADEALQIPEMPPEESLELAKELCLEVFLCRLA